MCARNNPEIVCLLESHLKPDILNTEIEISHYNIFRADRSNRSHGGIINYVHETLNAEEIISYSNSTCELLIIHIQEKNCLICTVYRPPDTKSTEFLPIIDKLKQAFQQYQGLDIVLTGDLNFPNIDWSDPLCRKITKVSSDKNLQVEKLLCLTDDYFLHQLISQPTRNDNILDLMFTNITDELYDCNISEYKTMSDHRMIELKLNCPQSYTGDTKDKCDEIKMSGFHSLNFHKADYCEINKDLADINWSELLNNKTVNDQLALFYETTLNIAKKHTSEKKVNLTKKKRSRFYKERKALWRKRRRVQKKKDSVQKQELLSEIEVSIKKSHKDEKLHNEIFAIDKIATNSKYFFTYANKTRKCKDKVGPLIDKDNKEIITDPTKIADTLQSQYCSVFSQPKESEKIENIKEFFEVNEPSGFRKQNSCLSQVMNHNKPKEDILTDINFTPEDVESCINKIKKHAAPGPDGFSAILLRECSKELSKPLYQIFRNSINTGDVPNDLKDAIITPIPKGGLKSDPKNYRPINLISHLLKALEKVICCRIVSFLEDNKKININQHGFRKLHSCLSQLIEHYDTIIEAVSSGANMDVVYLDFSKAFDVVDHNILLRKLKAVGISGKIGLWIHNFITGRRQTVSVNKRLSSSEIVRSGVPQGSCLGPILFLIMISDIDDKDDTESTVSSFADDTKVSRIIRLLQDCDDLQTSLNHIYNWSSINNMNFNELKFKALRYGGDIEDIKDFKYKTPTGKEIPFESSVKDLGIIMSNNLTFKEHIETLATRCRGLSAWILRTFITRQKSPMMILFNSLILPRIDYCSQLWAPHYNKDWSALEAIQRRFTNQIDEVKSLDYWSRLKSLRLYSTERRTERYQIIYLWKIIEGFAPNLKVNKICTKFSNRRGRSCLLPKLKRRECSAKTTTLRESSFGIHAPKLFNCLPKHIRDITSVSVDTFKLHLDRTLTNIPDQPSVTGYSGQRAAASNSIIHQIQHLRGGASGS